MVCDTFEYQHFKNKNKWITTRGRATIVYFNKCNMTNWHVQKQIRRASARCLIFSECLNAFIYGWYGWINKNVLQCHRADARLSYTKHLCIHTDVYVYKYICAYVYVHIYTNIHTWNHMILMYTSTHHICTHVYTYMYIYREIQMCNIYLYVYIYI